MKKIKSCYMKFSTTLLLFFMLAYFSAHAQDNYYWYGTKKISLTKDPDVTYFKIVNNSGKKITGKAALSSALGIAEEYFDRYSDSEIVVTKANKFNADKISEKGVKVVYAGSRYADSNGFHLLVLPNISVELQPGQNIKNLLSKYGDVLSIRKDRKYNTYLLATNLATSSEVLKLSNTLSENKQLVKWAEPEFY